MLCACIYTDMYVHVSCKYKDTCYMYPLDLLPLHTSIQVELSGEQMD